MSDWRDQSNEEIECIRREEQYWLIVPDDNYSNDTNADLVVHGGYSNLLKVIQPVFKPLDEDVQRHLQAGVLSENVYLNLFSKFIESVAAYGHLYLLKRLTRNITPNWNDVISCVITQHQHYIILYVLKIIDVEQYSNCVEGWISHLEMIGDFNPIEAFCNVFPNTDINSPLICATYAKCFKLVKYLVESGANVNYRSYFSERPLEKAVESGDIKIVKYLLSKGATFDEESKDVIMCDAVSSGNIAMIEYLMTLGFTLTNSVFDVKFSNYKLEMFKFFVSHGLDLNAFPIMTLLLDEDPSKAYDTLEYLFTHVKFNRNDLTAMLDYNIRIRNVSVKIVELLLSYGTELPHKPNIRIIDENIPLVEFLLDHNPKLAKRLRESDLKNAIVFGSVKIVRHMLNAGIKLNPKALIGHDITNQEILDMLNTHLGIQLTK
jgi:ankyrin repeat protein